MYRHLKGGFALIVGLIAARPATAQTPQSPVTAIDILLEADATMTAHATTLNQRLLAMYPKGFVLGTDHQPHISCLQRYVRTADLDNVYQAVSSVLATEIPTTWKLKAFADTFVVWNKLGLTVVLIEPTADLIRYQKKLIDAVAPFTMPTGTAAAFVTTPKSPDINTATIEYVAAYVPKSSGKHFTPHVTVGVAPPADVKKMIDEKKFDAFTFSPVGVSVYQLGNFGTAAKKLKGWELRR